MIEDFGKLLLPFSTMKTVGVGERQYRERVGETERERERERER